MLVQAGHGGVPVKLMKLSTYDTLNGIELAGHGRLPFYHKPQVEEIKAAFLRLSDDESAWKRYIEEQTARASKITEFAKSCRIWTETIATSRALELRQMRQRRFEAITERLRRLGWGDELDKLVDHNYKDYRALKELSSVRLPKHLTDYGWETISDELVTFMQCVKDRRILEEREAILRKRFASLSSAVSEFYLQPQKTKETEYKPAAVDFAFMPEIRDIIEAPHTEELGPDNMEALRALLPALVDRWQADVRAQLTLLLKENITELPNGTILLHMAVAHFQCNVCSRLLQYPNVIAHACLRSYFHNVDLSDNDFYKGVICEATLSSPWSVARLRCPSTTLLAQIRKIIQVSGKDPDQAPREEMDDLDVRVCFADGEVSRKRSIMVWTAAVRLAYKHIQTGLPMDTKFWQIVTPEDYSVVRATEDDQLTAVAEGFKFRQYWCCSLCSNRTVYMRSAFVVGHHLRTQHAVDDSAFEENMYWHPDGVPAPFEPKIVHLGTDSSW